MNTTVLQREWLSNVKTDILSGVLVALALIPEAIAFSIIAGVDPKVGLYASFIIAVVTAFVGGRPALISAATGAMALLVISLVKKHGVDYLFAATILTGIFQIIFAWLKLGSKLKYVPRAVMIGFVNALAVLIFMAQLPQLTNVPWQVYPMVAGGLAIIYVLPRFTKAVPSPLVAIIVLTAISIIGKIDVPTVGDMGELPTTLPFFKLPQIPLNLETLQIIFPYAVTLSIVGLLESLLTASLVDELTDTPSNKNTEAQGQGIANIITGFFGGMAGCAMIGQSVININSGGRTRLSTLVSGVFLLFLILALGFWVKQIPMASLVAVMIMVAIGTFSWTSLKTLLLVPRSETAVMVTTVLITVLSHNLALGVIVGVVMSTVFFSRKIAKVVFVDKVPNSDQNHRIYNVAGPLFFLSIEEFIAAFDFQETLDWVKIDLTNAHIWDQAAVTAIDKVVIKFRRNGVEVELVGLNEASATLLKKLALHDKSTGLDNLASH
ncbi:sodium-independent anion transporter [Nostoc cf. commune SO-36]|uniref:Sodium-independent anion transporter n=1 Tax=Nostoc cf. commune SO-36 TaxID=449208 RepID=A0ABM7YV11_NOSCO|nr:SulP family inorganic anion transporter [Nostoc commune]BDI14456.1 sodium-independent anion transporter [Nostoc cf. commune SO-36]